MIHALQRRWPWAGLLFLFLGVAAGSGAELPQFTGYTRPGNPSDTVVEGRVVFAVEDPQVRKQALGGTVYYMVLERSGDSADPWGAGHKDMIKRFQPGVDFSGVSSPALDTSAKYLYLYQTVNDRHSATPISSTAVKLLVDLKDVTSWGHFASVGFATPSQLAPGAKEKTILPVSYSNVVAAAPGDRAYRVRAPAISITPRYQLVPVPTQRGERDPVGKGDGPAKLVWDALDPANNPDYVMLLSGSDFESSPSFRAIWTGDNVLKKDVRSTVFGFTSNLPPTIEPVRIRGLREPAKPGEPIRPAGTGPTDPEGREAGIVAEGRVPTPLPESTGVGGGPGGVFPPLAAGPGALGGGGGGGFGGVPGVGAGAIGSAAAPAFGGGGANTAGTGSTESRGRADQGADQSQAMFFNATLVNAQSQLQHQLQEQSEHQEQNCCPSPEVIPVPPAWLLGAVGLPFLLLLHRARAAG
jgi:hypothetical protein